ncbi:penicillin-binding protein 1A [Neptunicella sp. SCSIO 80796]|uniref:penicillin-binding protein 1A n=1 Tax=Neptunicella plasticusilytica TaxID=3117012 RepID=UPI003A4D9146
MKYLKPLIILLLVSVLLGVATIASFYIYLKPQLPSVDVLKDVHLQTPMKIYSQDGKLISQFGVKRRIPLSIEQIPPQLINAVLATEDSRFYDHPGIDIIGVFRAAVNLITTGEKGQGASTITMQLARGFFLTREKAYIRKIKEIFIAWHIEQVLTKNEILELYMNKIELGHRAFGFGAAAQVYYGKDVNELNLAQIATLAGLPQAPSVLNPISRPDRSKARRRLVLLRMLDENYINREQYNQAVEQPVTAKPHGAEIELHAPYIADMAYNEMIRRYGKEDAETRGLSVYLTIPSDLQTDAQQAVIRNLHDYDERHGYRGPIRQLWEEPETERLSEQQQDQPNTTDSDMAMPAAPVWSEEQMLQELATQITYAPLNTAIVIRTFERSIEVFTSQGEYLNIDWDGIAWAREFINDSKQGPDPQVATDIVTAGAMVYIRKRDDDSGQWQLSQVPDVSGAFVALNPENGAIQALVGGYSFYQSQFNRATQAKRQVGSNIKPFVYSAALDAGYTLASVINDAPINQSDRDSGIAWRPKNSDGKYDGPIRMRVGLGKSKNMVSIRLLRGVGLDKVIDHLARFGFNPKELPHDETLAIGSASLTPMEVATGFAIINNGGYAVEPYLIDRIEDLEKLDIWKANPKVACRSCRNQIVAPQPEERHPGEPETPPIRLAPQVLDSQNAFLVTDMMRTGLRANGSWTYKTYWQGTGWRARNILQREDLAGKTGTTNDAKDTWFSGFTPDLVATAWVGFDDMSRSLGRTSANQYLLNKNPEQYNWLGNAMVGGEDGARAAQPAWIRFMQKALKDVPEKPFFIPPDIVTVRIDRTTGKLTQRTDHTSRFEYFKKGTEPTQYVREDELVDPYLEDQGQPQQEPEDIF